MSHIPWNTQVDVIVLGCSFDNSTCDFDFPVFL